MYDPLAHPLPPPRPHRGPPLLLVVLVASISGFAAARLSLRLPPAVTREAASPRPVEARGRLAEDEAATIELFRKASPSVVYITTLARRAVGFFDVMEAPQGTGSGFVWDASGHVVTNFHVLAGASSARVGLADNTVWEAAFVGGAADRDLAVLRIGAPAGKLKPILVGTSRDLQVGQKVFAIGNPFGLDQTLTTGIVSALGRSIESATRRRIEGVIQTDAAINPGNSGGPLLDSAGRLVGVNTAIASPVGQSSGIGFAVPVDTVNKVVPELIRNGRLIRPQLGIVPADDAVSARLGLPGVLVLDVREGTGAAHAGVRPTTRDEAGSLVLGDVIRKVDGKDVASNDDLLAALEERRPGDVVEIVVRRGHADVPLRVTLSEPR